MKRLIAVAAASIGSVALLAACGGPVTGVVVEKEYEPKSWGTAECWELEIETKWSEVELCVDKATFDSVEIGDTFTERR